ncbi:MAG: hypothetical protein ACRD5M_15960 [Candidatus Acidiferrales bacterium]
MFGVLLLAGTFVAGQSGSSKHSVTVTFDYDFGRTPACSEKVLKNCVKQFVVYDISAGVQHRTKLFSFPADPAAKGFVKGITATSPKLLFESGKHLISVAAQTPTAVESDVTAAKTWIEVP